jgi:hypothetical protein
MNPMGVGVVRPAMDEHKALYRLGMLHRAIVACQA